MQEAGRKIQTDNGVQRGEGNTLNTKGNKGLTKEKRKEIYTVD